MGLPAEFFYVDDLLPEDEETPIEDCAATAAGPGAGDTTPGPPAPAEEAAPPTYTRAESVRKVVCPSLNSGLPVIVLTDPNANHAFTIIGWREGEEGIDLIVSDDQVGPYELVTAAEIEESWESLMIPLPAQVLLLGHAAEGEARNRIALAADRVSHGKGDRMDNDFASLADEDGELKDEYRVRSRLLRGREFKAALGEDRGADLRTMYRLAHLSEWVWLVEIQTRESDPDAAGPVFAEIVFDSTSVMARPLPLVGSTLTMAKDGIETTGAGADGAAAASITSAPGPGRPWASLITDRAGRGTSAP